jgi:hypothetical protein
MFKQVIIAAGLFLLIQVWIQLPMNNEWWKERIGSYYKEYKTQKRKMNLDFRWEERHGYNYLVPKQMASFLDEEKDVLLLPPKAYFTNINPQVGPVLQWLDARWFYYMAEKKVKLAYMTDSSYQSASHAVLFNNQSGFYLQPLDNPAIKDTLFATFKKSL